MPLGRGFAIFSEKGRYRYVAAKTPFIPIGWHFKAMSARKKLDKAFSEPYIYLQMSGPYRICVRAGVILPINQREKRRRKKR